MILSEPLECIIKINRPFAYLKVEGGKYLSFNGFQIVNLDDKDIEKDYITLIGKDVEPFILVHNMRISNIINALEGMNNHKDFLNTIKNAYIENELITNLTVNDIYHEYGNCIITYDELYLMLITYYQNIHKYLNKP